MEFTIDRTSPLPRISIDGNPVAECWILDTAHAVLAALEAVQCSEMALNDLSEAAEKGYLDMARDKANLAMTQLRKIARQAPPDPAVEATRRMIFDAANWPWEEVSLKRTVGPRGRIETAVLTKQAASCASRGDPFAILIPDGEPRSFATLDELLGAGWVVT